MRGKVLPQKTGGSYLLSGIRTVFFELKNHRKEADRLREHLRSCLFQLYEKKKTNRGKKAWAKERNTGFGCLSCQPLQDNILPSARGWLKGWKIMTPHQIFCLVDWSLLLTGIWFCSYLETNQMNSSVELQPNSHTYTKNTLMFHHQAPLSPLLMQFSHCLITCRLFLCISLPFSWKKSFPNQALPSARKPVCSKPLLQSSHVCSGYWYLH